MFFDPLSAKSVDSAKHPSRNVSPCTRFYWQSIFAVANLNACVLFRGVNFSGTDDRKKQRLKEIFEQFVSGGYDVGI